MGRNGVIVIKNLLTLLTVLFLCACSSMNWWGDSNYVTVRKGDTLYNISRRYNVAMKDMISTNRLSAPYTLYVGQKLRLPGQQYHTVQRGESLYSISRQHNVDVATLSKINHLKTPYSLFVGQRLLLPSSAHSASSQPTAYAAQHKNRTLAVAEAQNPSYVRSNSNFKAYNIPTNAPAKNRSSKFMWPVNGTVISGFGNLGKGRKNDGINIKAPLGTAVKAADGGTVAYSGNELKGFGNLILIKHSDGWITAYAHNEKLLVKKGQKVVKGEKIATVGNSGSVTSPQLHFEVRTGKKAVNPRNYLP